MVTTASTYIQAINENYPIAGQNNDSQGFRDNFTNIKDALSATNEELVGLQINSLFKSQDNDFGGYAIQNVNLVNASTPIAPTTDGTVDLDYTIATFWPVALTNSGINSVNIVNMPEAQRTGNMIVSVTTSSLYTKILFTATTGTVVSAGPSPQPFDLSNSGPYLFEIWNDYTDTNNPFIYVKKLSEDRAEAAYLNSIVNATTYTGGSATFDRSLTLGNLTFTTGTVRGSYDATIVTDGTHYGNLALVPNIVTTEITEVPVSPPGGMTNQVGVFDPSGIQIGATLYFAGTNTSYIVDHVNGMTVYTTTRYNVHWTQIGQSITFVNLQFNSQPTISQFSNIPSLDKYGTVTPGATRNLKGTIYADNTSLQVTYSNPNGINVNTFNLNISTTTTNTASNDVATVGYMNNLLPAGSVIMWYGNQFALPYGWVICDGSLAPNNVATPDLRNQFVIGATSDYAFGNSSIPATEVTGVQTTSGGTSTSIIVSHNHIGTGTTFAVHDPGHQHASVGANQKSGHTPNPQGPYGNAPVGETWWGFDEDTAANAVQWYTSKEYTFQDQQGSTPLGGGVKLQTDITIESTGTDSGAYANLPPYMALYYIYKWIG